MKKLMSIAFALLLSLSALADGEILASYRFAQNKNGSSPRGFFTTYYKAELLETGELKISSRYTDQTRFDDYDTFRTIELKRAVKGEIIDMVKRLANAEIESRYAGIVCMMYPHPSQSENYLSVKRDYDWRSSTFNGGLELVKGPQGCWIGHKVSPKEDAHDIIAEKLKTALRMLAIQ
jgi:hypothetical protein